MKKEIMTLCCLSLALAGCAGKTSAPSDSSDTTLYSNVSTDAGFDTVFYYQEYNDDRTASENHFNEAVSLFTHYNDLFDIYNTYDGLNNLKTINDNAGVQPVKVDPDIIDMLNMAKQFYTWSEGEFDITIGSLLNVWHTYREEGIKLNEEGKKGKVPSEAELSEAAVHKGWDHVQIDADADTVYIDDSSISLDVGGIAKGYATEKIAETLEKESDIGTVAINAGGNNRTIGTKPDGTDWNVRIQNPDGGDKLIIVSEPGSKSFVTSGDYERYYEAEDGKRYHHIIDPETDFPSTYYRSVSIITEDSGAADCLSTTLFTLSMEEGQKVLDAYEKQTGIHADAIWVMNKDQKADGPNEKKQMDYYICYTDGLKDHITWE
ncbi:MAG: FAD:protein FMN transferase [Solobacterium sp.]|jgi:thiamine biosynthesis lipoprotein|nr:FAD:protein FMN transferase [Solobacterium sp.]MCH4049735.1 FAD:protein FMN transferase [Solobacterium sp.]MCH4073420.1 FAD:protein FMN transferase [Solobacterium sp.]MCI1313440.1 FAD:protein FMN transferase [Solobacterium sp.]MCI1345656.1 FAD:protein FMN transferase [Solobacterium sp.]